jgi:hypothetical protein
LRPASFGIHHFEVGAELYSRQLSIAPYLDINRLVSADLTIDTANITLNLFHPFVVLLHNRPLDGCVAIYSPELANRNPLVNLLTSTTRTAICFNQGEDWF